MLKNHFSDNVLKESKNKIDYWFSYLSHEIGYGNIVIEFDAKKNQITIQPAPFIKIKSETGEPVSD